MTKVYISDSNPLEDPALYKKAYALLNSSRKEKVDRYQSEGAKRNCIVAYLLLKHALKEERIDLSYEEIEYGDHGKPYLKSARCFFNVSHAKNGMIAVAVSDGEVGIDIEAVEEHKGDIARRYFTENENAVLEKSANKEGTFTRFWTLKEAILKKIGTGLAESLSTYDFSKFVYLDSFDAYGCHFEALDFGDCPVSVAMTGELEFVSAVDVETLIYDK